MQSLEHTSAVLELRVRSVRGLYRTSAAALDVFHCVVVEAEVVAHFMGHYVPDELSHFFGIGAILLDGTLIDVVCIGQDVDVEGVAAGQIDTTIEAIQGIGGFDPHLFEGLVVRPVLDDDRDVRELLPEGPWELLEGGFDQVLELVTGHWPARRLRGLKRREDALDAAETFDVDDVLDLADALHDVL